MHKSKRLARDVEKRLSKQIASRIHVIDNYLGQHDENPSILFDIFRCEPHRRRNVTSLLSFLSSSSPSIHLDGIALGFALNMARHADRFPRIFQRSLQILLRPSGHTRSKITRYFSRRKFAARRIPFTSAQLIQCLVDAVVATPSLRLHLPLTVRIIRTWDTGPVPLKIVHSLIWSHIQQTVMPEISLLKMRYWPSYAEVISPLSYNVFISIITYTVQQSDPAEVDILLLQALFRKLLHTDHYLHALSIFGALQEVHLGSSLGSEILMSFFEKLLATENYEDALHVYSVLLQSQSQEAPNDGPTNGTDPTLQKSHIEFVQRQPALVVALLRGARRSSQSQPYITELLTIIPADTIFRNHHLAVEMLLYAGYWGNQDLVRGTLKAIGHPFYDETHTDTKNTPRYTFSEEIWSAILSAHVHLGLINASKRILRSMQNDGLQPRPKDMSAIVCGVAKFNLTAGYDLATKLVDSLNIDAYETLLEMALEQRNEEIVNWAKGLVAYECPEEPWVQSQILSDEELLDPQSYKMDSQLSAAMAFASIPTRTPRAVGAIIKHVASTGGTEVAIPILLNAKMAFSRDVYDRLYEIAFENGQLQHARWLANEMRQRGWMPRNYQALET